MFSIFHKKNVYRIVCIKAAYHRLFYSLLLSFFCYYESTQSVFYEDGQGNIVDENGNDPMEVEDEMTVQVKSSTSIE
jgi:hypothetical protein